MQNKKPMTDYERMLEARKALADWNRKREEEAKEFPINWDNFGTDRPTVEKKQK